MATIQLLHPEGKNGARIQEEKYKLIKDTLIDILNEKGAISYKELVGYTRERLKDTFEGSITWYVTAVKLDIEARGLIKRFTKNKLQHIELVK